MREFEYINTTPSQEVCIQLGNPNYQTEVKLEIRAFIDQLKRGFGEPPAGVEFRTNSNNHDLGTYYDIRIDFNDEKEEHIKYVINLIDQLPEKWDTDALKFIREQRQLLYDQNNPILKIA